MEETSPYIDLNGDDDDVKSSSSHEQRQGIRPESPAASITNGEGPPREESSNEEIASGTQCLPEDGEEKLDDSKGREVVGGGEGREEELLEQQYDDEDQEEDDEEEGATPEPKSPMPPSSPSWPGSEGSWSEEKWLQMADFYDAQRRPTTTAAVEARKLKYPELYRSDVTICPSYTQFQVPYWSVCRRRYARSYKRITQQLAREVEEMALLQTRALDGVRVVRSFSQGARPVMQPQPDPLTEKERRRVERLLTS